MLLCDHVTRELGRGRKSALFPYLPPDDVAAVLQRARKIILDHDMSAFLYELQAGMFNGLKPERREQAYHSIRRSALLPFEALWFEWDMRAFRDRMLKDSPNERTLVGEPMVTSDEVPGTEGVLVRRVGSWAGDDVLLASMLVGSPDMPVVMLPFSFKWTPGDTPFPSASDVEAMLGVGITGLLNTQMSVVYHQNNKPKPGSNMGLWVEDNQNQKHYVHKLLVELAGAFRYALAFMATMNDLPVVSRDVAPEKRHMVAGNYRRLHKHTALTLNMAGRFDVRRLARKTLAIAKRRQHPVRGHWRLYSFSSANLCAQESDHVWQWQPQVDEHKRQRCANCSARRTFIEEHKRGAAEGEPRKEGPILATHRM